MPCEKCAAQLQLQIVTFRVIVSSLNFCYFTLMFTKIFNHVFQSDLLGLLVYRVSTFTDFLTCKDEMIDFNEGFKFNLVRESF